MKTTKMLAILVLALGLMVCFAQVGQAAPMGTAFTYQARLIDANSAADGLYDFEFKLFDDPCTGTQQGGPIDVNDLDVIDGYFTVELDFGSDVFDGDARWLETTVSHADGSDPCTLRPRIEVTPTPYALHTPGLSLTNTENTLVGVGAGENNAGSYGTFVGYNAGYNNEGNYNTFLGRRAGYLNTTGYNNTFLGYYAGYNNTTGFTNTFLGYNAGYSNDEGNYNTFLGQYAGRFNTMGGYNTFLGMKAGNHNTTGRYNTFLGAHAGGYNTTGNDNTFLGYYAGYNSTGTGNVFLGYKAGYSETRDNKLYIANGPSNANVLIYGDFSTGNVGIGTTNPTSQLSVIKQGTDARATVDIQGQGTGGGATLTLGSSDLVYYKFRLKFDAATGDSVFENKLGTGDYRFRTWNGASFDERFTILNNGNVGIGTTDPAATLTVNGAILRQGSMMHGYNAETHINLGVNSATGKAGENYAYATVSGGLDNEATAQYAVVGGGYNNTSSGWESTVAGGFMNEADGQGATVGGGQVNIARNYYSTVPGGYANEATGRHSFAAGHQAKANHDGAFVWADSAGADFASTAINQFLIRASGGVGIGTNSPGGFLLAVNGSAAKPGGGSWSVFSDRQLKKNIEPLAGVLDRMLQLKGVSFEYRDPEHFSYVEGEQMGMIAQEVEKVFPGWVEQSAGYKTVTYRGFEAVTVEAFRQLRKEKDAEIAAMKERLAKMEAAISQLIKSNEGGQL